MKRALHFVYWVLSRFIVYGFWFVTLPITLPLFGLLYVVQQVWDGFKEWERDREWEKRR